ncbi:2-oxoglutarate-Fe(II)-dependent dioxygenase family protein [Archangium gephyra]|uniref:2-oxoglutarate-Fe(II)-dependent dioxygenase family protein n=1 Tax=Archangium gephyra TaxID=48 RepID=A0AAC8QF69_9BACT|nr:2OG-Fe dioxygenase family protein [Archangium gephyra]AKJ06233.1 Hypothetical protein AA314_07859 [Archangium gephyra]REG27016.1 2-oxoglutarate-Fe(II)-dependent dioxygenase family protein [Archangium gephyra]
MNIVDGYKFVPGSHYMEGLTEKDHARFLSYFESQIQPDPYSSVRDRGMIKIVYNRSTHQFSKNSNQTYFQSYSANDTDGGKVRVFPRIGDELLSSNVFQSILYKNQHYLDEYCDRTETANLNISVHFIRYKAPRGGASYSSPIWLHLDDEPLVFIHLIQLTRNAIGADSVISGMDNKPTNVLRLARPFDTLIVDKTKKHAVTPLGSTDGIAYRDVMLINLEAKEQQR